jgi:hypothetical protein
MALTSQQLFQSDIDALAAGDKCEIAKSRWRSAHLFKNFFWGLLAFLCLTLLAAIVAIIAMLFFAEDRDTEAIITGIGLLVDGVIVGFLIKQIRWVTAQEKIAFDAAQKACPS